MINSMTGYGQAEGEVSGVTYAVEIKTVNNRYFKTSVKLPDTAAFLEEDIERLLRKEFSRGTVNYVLRFKNTSADVLFNIDEVALRAMIVRLSRVASSVDIECPIDIGNLLGLPGILVPVSPDDEAAEQIRARVLTITQEAINKVKQMRAAEGAALEADLEGCCEAIKQSLEQIRTRSAAVLEEYHRKLEKRANELLAVTKLNLDEEILAREVAIFAERSDISEEIVRLDSHLQKFAEGCRTDRQAGRRLEFISQEMFRETNTIASKVSDIEVTHLVVDMKCQIDRIKEQVQNIE